MQASGSKVADLEYLRATDSFVNFLEESIFRKTSGSKEETISWCHVISSSLIVEHFFFLENCLSV